jgi:hypothetical protein
MRRKRLGIAFGAVLALFLGIAAPGWAVDLADPLGEFYGQHIIPFYRIDGPWISVLVLADTSFQRGSDIRLWFFDQACSVVRDDREALTANDVDLLTLNAARFAGIPEQGVIFLDSCDLKARCQEPWNQFPFLAYVLLFNTADNRLIRLDSIPFNWAQRRWLRYNQYNTVAATIMDTGAFETWLTFFNVRGDLADFALIYGPPINGRWVGAGKIQLDAYDDEERFLGSFIRTLRCFERFRLSAVIPQLATRVGHILTFSHRQPFDGFNRRTDYSGFQETVLGNGVKFIATGYLHHSSEAGQPFRTLDE